MNVGSLFSGIGGFDLGLERAGHRVVFQCESDPFRRRVLARHWPGVPCGEDVVHIRKSTGGSFVDGLCPPAHGGRGKAWSGVSGDIDLLCGGFPCQDLSVAGKRAGLDGERSGLFFEFARIADDLLGSGGWLLIENVPGLLSSNGGRDFAVLLATLAELGFHDLAWRVLDSRYLGVPQRRRRVFILARRSRGRSASEVLLEPESGGGDFEAGREERARAAGGAGPSVDRTGATQSLSTRFGNSGADLPDAEAGWLVGTLAQGRRGYDANPENRIVPAVTSKWRKGTGGPAGDETQNLIAPDVAAPLTKGSAASEGVSYPGRRKEDDENLVTHTLTSEGADASEDGTGRGTPLVLPDRGKSRAPRSDERDAADQGGERSGDSVEPSDRGRGDGSPSDPDRVRAPSGVSGRVDGGMTAQAITRGDARHPSGREAGNLVTGTGTRPTNHCAHDPKPDGPRYAACGDAVTVQVAEWIGRRLP